MIGSSITPPLDYYQNKSDRPQTSIDTIFACWLVDSVDELVIPRLSPPLLRPLPGKYQFTTHVFHHWRAAVAPTRIQFELSWFRYEQLIFVLPILFLAIWEAHAAYCSGTWHSSIPNSFPNSHRVPCRSYSNICLAAPIPQYITIFSSVFSVLSLPHDSVLTCILLFQSVTIECTVRLPCTGYLVSRAWTD